MHMHVSCHEYLPALFRKQSERLHACTTLNDAQADIAHGIVIVLRILNNLFYILSSKRKCIQGLVGLIMSWLSRECAISVYRKHNLL